MKRPIVYISLGTIINREKDFYKICFDAFKDENLTVILSLGKGISPEKFKNIPNNFHVYSFVLQIEVLKYADIFITHGGMNSINEGINAGVPMIVIPMANDQPTNANKIIDLNLGKRLDKKSLNKSGLRNAVIELINDTSIKESIDKIKVKTSNLEGDKIATKIILESLYKREK